MGNVHILRTVNADMTSYGGFVWPESGPVECDDWNPRPTCGNGLHGFLRGEGDGVLASWLSCTKWLVVRVDESTIVDLCGKVKFPRGEVVYCGEMEGAVDLIMSLHPEAKAVIGSTVEAGGYKTACTGYCGTATAGYCGTAIAGHRGTSKTGIDSTAITGCFGASATGHRGTSITGIHGTASAGHGGTIMIKYYDFGRDRIAVGYIGENGLKANTEYRLNCKREFEEVE